MQVSELEQRQNYTNWHKNSEYCSQSFLHQPPTHPLTASLMLLMLILYCRRKYMVNNSKERLIFEKNTFWIKRQIYSDLRRFRGVETVLENTPPIGWNWHSVFQWFELSKDATVCLHRGTERFTFPGHVYGWIFQIQKNFFIILFREPTFIW